MIDESKLIFFTGAPGSKWSATAHILTHNKKYPINTSDYSEERTYTHEDINISHLGAYWGPGNGIGENFHNLSSMSKKDIIFEIDRAYRDNNWEQYRLVKCHHFSLHLEFIKKTFPLSKIIMVLRPDDICAKGWLHSGFEKITYPNYRSFYKNEDYLVKMIKIENHNIRNFILNNNLDSFIVSEKYWKEVWGIERNTEELDRYIKSIEMIQSKSFPIPKLSLDTTISHYNFNI